MDPNTLSRFGKAVTPPIEDAFVDAARLASFSAAGDAMNRASSGVVAASDAIAAIAARTDSAAAEMMGAADTKASRRRPCR